MSVLYLALPLALVLAAVAVAAFMWSVNDGQLDDLDTPSVRLLNDDKDGLKKSIPASHSKDKAARSNDGL